MRRPPAILLVLAVIGAALFVLPLIGLLGVTPWTDLGSLLTDD
ncbi:MAG: molybdate ABC transporter permease subunit, partial [Phycisphaeraceae bacterium]|nr:molybdate ABC transporter permease subunit [Phycisphaeraceae bacterium]